MEMLHEPANRAMWHRDCPNNKWRSGIMGPVSGVVLTDSARMQHYYCLHCGESAWYVVDGGKVSVVEDAAINAIRKQSFFSRGRNDNGAVFDILRKSAGA